MVLTIDASVAVKWYVEESGSDTAHELLEGSELLIAPAHAPAEIGQALIYRMQKGNLPRHHVDAAILGLRRTLVLLNIEDLMDEAVEITANTPVSFYDALYVSAAVRSRGVLVTADMKMIRALESTPWSSRVVVLGDPPSGRSPP